MVRIGRICTATGTLDLLSRRVHSGRLGAPLTGSDWDAASASVFDETFLQQTATRGEHPGPAPYVLSVAVGW